MKGQPQLAAIPALIIVGIILFIVLPPFLKSISDINECTKTKEQLNDCQNSLSSIDAENKNLKNQLENTTIQMNECQNETSILKQKLMEYNNSLLSCQLNIDELNKKINDLSSCCNASLECNNKLINCLNFNRTINTVNVWEYTVSFVDVQINIAYLVSIFASIPLFDLSINLISVEVKFRRKKTEKASFLIKCGLKLIAFSVTISFFFKVPLIPSIVLITMAGLCFCNEFFEKTYKNKINLDLE